MLLLFCGRELFTKLPKQSLLNCTVKVIDAEILMIPYGVNVVTRTIITT